MTIASEIQDLQTNLQAAKTAVTTKGGTVGDTGLAGLASEIASIPSGGGPLSSYGTITYLDNQTLTLADESDYLKLTIGGSGANIIINNTTVNKNDITSVTIADGVQYIPDNFCYGCNNMTTATLPSSIHFIGDNVFQGTAVNSPLNLVNVLYIGTYFLGNDAAFNQIINLPNINEIGQNFLSGCSSFNSALTLGNDLKGLDSRFLYQCSSFAQSITLPSNIEFFSSARFMYNCNSFTGPLTCNVSLPSADNYILATTDSSAAMYTTGVTLTGTYAQAWKDALADRDSSPYRKLIVGS